MYEHVIMNKYVAGIEFIIPLAIENGNQKKLDFLLVV